MLTIPSAFTRQTGEAHWHVLMRARAIENGCFVLAAAQGGTHENGRETFGHSLVVDPWGRIVAEGGTEPGVIMAEIDPAAVAAARARIPSLQHGRRFEIIEPHGGADAAACGQGRVMIRYALVCDRRHRIRGLVQQFRRLRQAGEARARRPARPATPPRSTRRSWRRRSQVRSKRKPALAHAPEANVASAPQPATRRSRCCRRRKREVRAKLKELRDHLTKNADNVGKKFPEEARKMHYGEIEHRSIYGEASADDAKKMLDEGIEFHPLPILPDDKN